MIAKKMVLIFFTLFVSVLSYGQDFDSIVEKGFKSDEMPFERILNLKNQKILMSGFYFDAMKNRYTLKLKKEMPSRFRFMEIEKRDISQDFQIYIYMGGDNRNLEHTTVGEVIVSEIDDVALAALDVVIPLTPRELKRAIRREAKEVNRDNDQREYIINNLKRETEKSIVQICFRNEALYNVLSKWMISGEKKPFISAIDKVGIIEVEHGKHNVRLMRMLHRVDKHLSGGAHQIIMNTIVDVSCFTPFEDYEIKSSKEYVPIYIFTIFTENEHNSDWLRQRQLESVGSKNLIEDLEDIL